MLSTCFHNFTINLHKDAQAKIGTGMSTEMAIYGLNERLNHGQNDLTAFLIRRDNAYEELKGLLIVPITAGAVVGGCIGGYKGLTRIFRTMLLID